jgi:hypothetical protein
MAFIFFSHPFSSGTEGLTGKPTGEDINFSSPNSKVSCLDIVIRFGLGPIKTTYFSTKRIDIAMELIVPPHPLGR